MRPNINPFHFHTISNWSKWWNSLSSLPPPFLSHFLFHVFDLSGHRVAKHNSLDPNQFANNLFVALSVKLTRISSWSAFSPSTTKKLLRLKDRTRSRSDFICGTRRPQLAKNGARLVITFWTFRAGMMKGLTYTRKSLFSRRLHYYQ